MYQLRDYTEGEQEAGCRCGGRLSILEQQGLPDGWPCFLICWDCRSVVEIKGEDGQTVCYRRGRRKKFMKVAKDRTIQRLKALRERRQKAARRKHGA